MDNERTSFVFFRCNWLKVEKTQQFFFVAVVGKTGSRDCVSGLCGRETERGGAQTAPHNHQHGGIFSESAHLTRLTPEESDKN